MWHCNTDERAWICHILQYDPNIVISIQSVSYVLCIILHSAWPRAFSYLADVACRLGDDGLLIEM